jgi:xanthine/CO dehydrogenase XdhC/CoxF family maturation factor
VTLEEIALSILADIVAEQRMGRSAITDAAIGSTAKLASRTERR